MQRNRLLYLVLTIVVIVAGLLSRSSWFEIAPDFLVSFAGDTLWALMVFLGLGLVFRTLPTTAVAVMALAFAFTIEVSQLYQDDWINRIRATRLGALVLGSGFLWSDLVCYTVGVLVGALGELFWKRKVMKHGLNHD
ncbi:MAG: DUF2809 domain-containing protein [Akkermansiaceae bacterium]